MRKREKEREGRERGVIVREGEIIALNCFQVWVWFLCKMVVMTEFENDRVAYPNSMADECFQEATATLFEL